MQGYEVVFGLILCVFLVIKHFGSREVDPSTHKLLLLGLAILVGGGFLALMVGLGSAPGAAIVGALAATGSGVCLLIALYYELIGRPEPRPAREPVERPPARRAPASPLDPEPAPARPAPRPQAARPAAPARPPARPAPRPAPAPEPEYDEGEGEPEA